MKNSSHWNTQMIYQDSLFTQPLTSLTTFIVVFSASVGRSEIISEKGRMLHFHVHLASLCRLVFYQVPGSVFFFETHTKNFLTPFIISASIGALEVFLSNLIKWSCQKDRLSDQSTTNRIRDSGHFQKWILLIMWK